MIRGAALLGTLAGVLVAGCAAPPAQGAGGIVSLNPCADAMLVELVPPDRIAAISHYSQDPGATSIDLAVARRLRATAGTAEEVIALRPGLVIASSFTQAATREAFARAGLRTLYLDSPATIAASRAQVAQLAQAVGAEDAGRAMIARIDAAIAAAAPPPGPRVPALIWIGGNLASGGGNLVNQMLALAGFEDRAARYGLAYTGYLPVETVAADPPRVMFVPDDGSGRDAGSRAAAMRARVLAHSSARVTEARFPRDLVNCGGPVIARAMTRLAEVRRSIAP